MSGITAALLATGCCNEAKQDFRYNVEQFADIRIIKFQVPGWDDLSLNEKAYVYHLCEATKWGRDIIWDQYGRYNLEIRRLLEHIITNYKGDTTSQEYADFLVYVKRVFFSNGIHHHYAEDKILPACSREFFEGLIAQTGATFTTENLLDIIFDPTILPQRMCTDKSVDIVANSGVNFYKGCITKKEAEAFYDSITDVNDPTPISYGLNSRMVKGDDGKIYEEVYKVGGLYSAAIEHIVDELLKAKEYAQNDAQKQYIQTLVDYYRTGDLRLWDKYNIEWVRENEGSIDFVNGFIEDYTDPLAHKACWEGLVNIKDFEASKRTQAISDNAQWFEDHSPVAPQFKKKEVKGVTAKVINAFTIAGESYPAPPIGINLPNADWIRRDYGSKSVTIANITHAYDFAAAEMPKSQLSEFAFDQAQIDAAKKYLAITNDVHTDLHECLGHGSGQLLPGTSSSALGEYSSTLEETRADLFGLYYMADPKLVELGILPDMEAYKAQYQNYILNGLFTQFTRVELGRKNTEAHMQNRKLIADWCYEKGKAANVIEKVVKDGKTYFVVNDFEALRGLFGDLLAEIQRIKSEGDFKAGEALVLKYAIDIDYDLHKEVLERYSGLGLKPYGGFMNPIITPVKRLGKIVDYRLDYCDDFIGQMLYYSTNYSAL